jgi:hypothetical protein
MHKKNSKTNTFSHKMLEIIDEKSFSAFLAKSFCTFIPNIENINRINEMEKLT